MCRLKYVNLALMGMKWKTLKKELMENEFLAFHLVFPHHLKYSQIELCLLHLHAMPIFLLHRRSHFTSISSDSAVSSSMNDARYLDNLRRLNVQGSHVAVWKDAGIIDANSMGAQEGGVKEHLGYQLVQNSTEGKVTIPRSHQTNEFPYPITQIEKKGLTIVESKREMMDSQDSTQDA